jgi:hypothetical protein
MIIHKFDQFYLVLWIGHLQTVLWTLENASLVGTNSGSSGALKEISPESFKRPRSLSIFINSIVLYSLVLSTPLRMGPTGSTLELKINIVDSDILKKLVL